METWNGNDDAALNREFQTFELPAEEDADGHVLVTRADWNYVMKANRDLWRENQGAIPVIERLRRDLEAKRVNLLAGALFFLIFGFVLGRVI